MIKNSKAHVTTDNPTTLKPHPTFKTVSEGLGRTTNANKTASNITDTSVYVTSGEFYRLKNHQLYSLS